MWLPFSGHGRWRERASAFADGELRPRDRERFAAHLGRCADCAALVDDLRLLKAAVGSLPATEAPRSFRLTPAMLAQPVAAAPALGERRPVVVARRVSQFASATAVVALAVVGLSAVDLGNGSGGDDSGGKALASRDAAAGAAESGGQAAANPVAGASPQATKTLPGLGGVAVGSSGLSATPTEAVPPEVKAQDTASRDGPIPPSTSAQYGTGGDNSGSRALESPDDGGSPWRLPVAIGLAAVACIAGGSAWALRRRDF
ncbi:MAG: zf-HC2 domain-containing protein [Chloroflexi bacterium]|nr:zf-HC2 domain-containing protein [Chloroflexota bacterium]